MASSQQRCVFVGNIPYDATEERLIQICEEVGPVVSFRLVLDRETGKPKGYGFCEYKDEETALSARRNLQGYEINGRQLRVDFAENGKGVDRNRDQGRGGPGLPPNVDSQKSTGPSILGDSSFNQPIGLQVASNAAFIISGALGQNMCNSQAGLIHDPLTNYLAAMTKKQLCDLMGELKVMAGHNKALVRQLLLESPQLSKALFQAQIMLGMVSPQVLQMPIVRQPSNSLLQIPLQENKQEQHSLYNKVPSVGTSAIPESIRVPHSSTHSVQVQHLPLHIQFHQQGQSQTQILPSQTGVSSVSGMQTHSLMEVSMRTQVPVPMIGHDPKLQSHPTSIPMSRSDTSVSMGLYNQLPLEGSINQNMTLPRASLLTSNVQVNSSSNSIHLGVAQKISKESGVTTTSIHSDQTARNMNMNPTSIVAQARPSSNTADVALIKTNDRASTLQSTLGDVNQQSEKQVAQLPLAPEVESALLQQVMSLTPEQLRSLPPDQRQQVIQLQQMLR